LKLEREVKRFLKNYGFLGTCLFLFIAQPGFGPSPGAWATDFLAMPVEGVEVAEYAHDSLTPIFQIHANRLLVEHERRGFFRIGLLPYLVAENVQIRIHSTEGLNNLLSVFHTGNLSPAAEHRLEIRGLEIFVSGEKSPRLRAAVARSGKDGAFELFSVQTFDKTGRRLSIPLAELQISGNLAGRLAWNLEGHLQEVLISQPTTNNSSKL
jgi:hypothetical protein